MDLLERDEALRQLDTALNVAVAGRGQVVLVSGQAGIGKTTLVEHFVREHGQLARSLRGACDSLFTPRPLGPLHDIAAQTQGELLNLLKADANRQATFSAALDEFQREPSVIVFEDVHWADEATLDLITFLGRRIVQTHTLFVLTYRDDELSFQHPLRLVIGDLPRPATLRIQLSPLSEATVMALAAEAGQIWRGEELYTVTVGNPFFVTEVLANPTEGVPATVRDAVLARAGRLSLSGRATLEAAAVLGPRIELGLLEEMAGAEAVAIEECLVAGMLQAQGDVLAFRHELARQTVLNAMSPQRRRAVHRLVLASLRKSSRTRNDFARMAHHAEAANDREAVLDFAPKAAREAVLVDAHREAVSLYALALRYADDLPAAEHAELLEAYAAQCVHTDQLEPAINARRKALQLWQSLGDRLHEGQTQSWLALDLVYAGQNAEAEQASRKSLETLEQFPAGPPLVLAYRVKTSMLMLSRDNPEAVAWAEKTIALATEFGSLADLASAHNFLGSALMMMGDPRGREHLEKSAAIGRSARLDGVVALALTNLASSYGELCQFVLADRYLSEGLQYCIEHDLDRLRYYLMAWQALSHLYQGRWNESALINSDVLQRPNVAAITRIMALVALGRLRTRRGDPGAMSALDEALVLAQNTETLQRLAPVRGARAEAAWLAGNNQQALEEARVLYDDAVDKQHPWFAGELAFWRWKAGDDVQPPSFAAAPYVSQILGNWREAAEAWRQLNCPYEQARALADGDREAQLAALEIFERLGAVPAIDALRRAMDSVPQRAIDKDRFGGLTERERVAAALIARGNSNREIAEAMTVSLKTVETYVTRILNKLGFDSRVQIATWAVSKGLQPSDDL